MQRYFFDSIDGQKTIDEDGEHLPTKEAALLTAVKVASELAQTRSNALWAGEEFKVVVRTGPEAVLAEVVLRARLVTRDRPAS